MQMNPRSFLLLVPTVVSFTCGGAQPVHEHKEPLGVAEHTRQAKEHDAEAENAIGQVSPEDEDPRQNVRCFEPGPPLTSGTERIKVMRPCWTDSQKEKLLRTAEFHRKAAAEHRRWASQLVETEAVACKGLGKEERSKSPFLYAEDILAVAPYKAGASNGARVTFRKVSGLSKEWMEHSIACHQAQAAVVGFDESFLSYCPLVVKGASALVTEEEATLTVIIKSKDPIASATILGRAERAHERR